MLPYFICRLMAQSDYLIVHMYPVWWGLHDTLVPLDSTYVSPGPPKMKTKFWKNVHQITSIFYILLSFGVILRCLWGLEALYIKCLRLLLTNVYWFRANGGYICGCGRPSNLVNFMYLYELPITIKLSLCHHWKYGSNPYLTGKMYFSWPWSPLTIDFWLFMWISINVKPMIKLNLK